jgi:precorrin-6B methylase 2
MVAFLVFNFFWDFKIFFRGSSYLSTPIKEIDEALRLLDLKEGENFYDLGSGDGRVLIEAVKKYKVNGKGIEINPFLVFLSKMKIKILGLEDLIKIERGDFFKKNLKDADAIFIYLNQRITNKLEEKLLKELKKGTRIVICPSSFKNIPLIKRSERFSNLKLYQIL